MPAPTRIDDSRLDPNWLRYNGELVDYLNSDIAHNHAESCRWGEVLEIRGFLYPRSTAALTRTMIEQRARSVDDVARLGDAFLIPNGVFRISWGSNTERFNIHIVQDGDLRGQRVIKRWVDGRFKAFASLTAFGEMKLWRRFESHRGLEYVDAAAVLLRAIRTAGRGRLFSDRSIEYYPTGQAVHHIEFTPRCERCNAESDDFDAYGYCDSCRFASPERQILVHLETTTSGLPRRTNTVPTEDGASVGRNEQPSQRATRNLLMSEVSGTEVR